MIYIVGDIHGRHDLETISNKSFKKQNIDKPTSDDIILQVGDLGAVWDPTNAVGKEELWLYKYYKRVPWKMITAGGNHENWERIFALPLVYVPWLNGEAYEYIPNKLYYAKRGVIYTINGETFFFAGGAKSYDAKYRIDGVSIWLELETMSIKEMDAGREALRNVNFQVDYIITHTAPGLLTNRYGFINTDITGYYLDDLINLGLKAKHWYFGHLHYDDSGIYQTIPYSCLYHKLKKLGD